MKIINKGLKSQKSIFIYILLILVLVLLLMPFIATFNDVLTRTVIALDTYKYIQKYIIPWEIRMVGVILYPFGLGPIVMGEYLAIGNEKPFLIEIAWNCIGWQSLLFFVITAIIGLQGGKYTNFSKAKSLLIGILGTFIINLLRIALVVIVAFYLGQNIAIIVHDFGSTLVVIGWLMFFWWFSFAFVLEEKTKA